MNIVIVAIREEKEIKGTQMGKEVKRSLFEDDAILDIETRKVLTIYTPISPNGPEAQDKWRQRDIG